MKIISIFLIIFSIVLVLLFILIYIRTGNPIDIVHLNQYVMSKGDIYRSWASLIQLWLVPLTCIALVGSMIQLVANTSKADIDLKFYDPVNLSINVKNTSSVIARKPIIYIDLIDATASIAQMNQTHLIKTYDRLEYIQSNGYINALGVMKGLLTSDHLYYGTVKVFCENCNKGKSYAIHFKCGSYEDFWIAKPSIKQDSFKLNNNSTVKEFEELLIASIPIRDRKYIKEVRGPYGWK